MSLVDEVEKAIEEATHLVAERRYSVSRGDLCLAKHGPAILAGLRLADATKAWRLAKFQSDLATKDVKGWDENVNDEYFDLKQLADRALLEADEKWAAFKRAEDAYRAATGAHDAE